MAVLRAERLLGALGAVGATAGVAAARCGGACGVCFACALPAVGLVVAALVTGRREAPRQAPPDTPGRPATRGT